jgi:hypothetical protein
MGDSTHVADTHLVKIMSASENLDLLISELNNDANTDTLAKVLLIHDKVVSVYINLGLPFAEHPFENTQCASIDFMNSFSITKKALKNGDDEKFREMLNISQGNMQIIIENLSKHTSK